MVILILSASGEVIAQSEALEGADAGARGVITLQVGKDEAGRVCFIVIAEDEGPGIPDIEWAMTAGTTSSGGLGLGLSGSKNLSDAFELWSEPGKGTRITALKYV